MEGIGADRGPIDMPSNKPHSEETMFGVLLTLVRHGYFPKCEFA